MTAERKPEGSRARSEKWAEAHGIVGLAKGADGESVADALRIAYAARKDAERDTRERCAQMVEAELQHWNYTDIPAQDALEIFTANVADAIRKGE